MNFAVTTFVLLLVCVWANLCRSIVNETSAPDDTYDALFEGSGYPATGDIPTLNRKIFKGIRVAIREHPYVVSVRRLFSHFLTGALISRNLVLTVAHPLYLVPIHEVGVVVGENYADRGTALLTVILMLFHENFDPYTLQGDLAMLRLYEEASIRTSVKTIQLFSPIKTLADKKGFVTGWGRCDMTGKELCLPRTSIYYPNENFDPMLRTVVFQITEPNYYCEGYKRQDVMLGPGMLCVGVAREENPVAPCLAVPGAPLVVNGLLVGVQSWGFGCGYSDDLPLVYTSVQLYITWILSNMEVLDSLQTNNYTELFQATKAYTAIAWLRETRTDTPEFQYYPYDLHPTSLDTELAKLTGNYYDIRDFVDNGRYRQKKIDMLKNIKLRQRQMEKINETSTINPKGEPFLNKDVIDDENDEDAEDNSD